MRRLAEDKDLDQVYSIYMDKSVIPFLGYDPMSLDDFRPIYEEMVGSGKSTSVFKVVGFYSESKYPGRAKHVAYFGTLAVSPVFRGEGIAKSMISEAIRNLKNVGIKRIEIIVESDNSRAISFYKSFGFEIEGTLKKFYKRSHEKHYVDDYIMAVLFN